MGLTAQRVLAVLEYLLLVVCLLAALIDLGGVGWFWGSFSTCQTVFLVTAPVTLLIASFSIFFSRLPIYKLVFFGSAVAFSALFYAIVSAGGFGLCTEPIRANVGLLPYLALLLLVGRIIMLMTNASANGARGV